MATYATGIWQRIRSRPCKMAPAIGLVFSYAFFLLLGIGATFIFELTAFALTEAKTELVSRTLPNGETVRVQVMSVRGQKLAETQVNDQGLFDGTHVAWHMDTGSKSKEGHWKDGYWDGEWKFWNPQGRLIEIVECDMGKPIRCSRLVDGVMKQVPQEDWSSLWRMARQHTPEGIKQKPGTNQTSNQSVQAAK